MYSIAAHTHRSRTRLAAWSVVALVLASCDSPTAARKAQTPVSIQIISGDNQSGVVGTDLTLPLVAKVLDANGRGLRDQTVTFSVVAGGGAVAPSSATSDQQGVVQARWTLGTASTVAALVQARVGSDSGAPAVTFQATALPGAAAAVTKLSGDAQRTEAGESLADSLTVKVVDRFDNGVGNVVVHWKVVSGGGTVSPTTSTTGGTGMARTQWTPSGPGSALARAEVTEIAPVTFTATVTVPLVFASVSAGYSYSCGVTTGGAAYCWGSNAYGQLGNGSTTPSTTPTAVVGGLTITSVSTGLGRTCGLTPGGRAYCWGADNGPTPVAVGGELTFASLTVGGWGFVCGLAPAGAAYCWGENGDGEFGDGTTTSSSTPVLAGGGLTFRSLSAGLSSTCDAASDGTAYCWGRAPAPPHPELCQVDENTGEVFCTRPIAVPGGVAFAHLGTGEGLFCGLAGDGAAHCWGNYPAEQWSVGSVAVPGELSFGMLSVGAQRACAVEADGRAYCWGWIPVQNQFSNTPTPVPGGLTFAAVSVGWFHTCGVTPSGAAYCWGNNSDGGLGDGSRANSLAPVKVTGPR